MSVCFCAASCASNSPISQQIVWSKLSLQTKSSPSSLPPILLSFFSFFDSVLLFRPG